MDVGTAQGDLITQVALANPHMEGIGYDLPPVEPVFEDYIAANGLSNRVKFAPGSFLNQPLPKADVVMMGHILHDWNLELANHPSLIWILAMTASHNGFLGQQVSEGNLVAQPV